jgi:hypothetical protein
VVYWEALKKWEWDDLIMIDAGCIVCVIEDDEECGVEFTDGRRLM